MNELGNFVPFMWRSLMGASRAIGGFRLRICSIYVATAKWILSLSTLKDLSNRTLGFDSSPMSYNWRDQFSSDSPGLKRELVQVHFLNVCSERAIASTAIFVFSCSSTSLFHSSLVDLNMSVEAFRTCHSQILRCRGIPKRFTQAL